MSGDINGAAGFSSCWVVRGKIQHIETGRWGVPERHRQDDKVGKISEGDGWGMQKRIKKYYFIDSLLMIFYIWKLFLRQF